LGLGALLLALGALALTLFWPDRVVVPMVLQPGQKLDALQADRSPAPDPLVAIFPPLTAVVLPQETDGRARIAIVLDDMGPDRTALTRASDLPVAVTFAFLPYAANVRALANSARGSGRNVLLHMPMEPVGAADPGPGALLVDQPPGEQIARLDAALAKFDLLDGVNNHMGSRLTADRDTMDRVMARLAGRDLFFLDSRTTAKTVAAEAAQHAGLATLSRDVFLDPDGTGAMAEAQLQRTLEIASATGTAIAIGHPHRRTLDALERFVATLDRTQFRMVRLSDLIPVSAGR